MRLLEHCMKRAISQVCVVTFPVCSSWHTSEKGGRK